MDERDTTATIDRALERGTTTATGPLERELEELTLALAAEAPEPQPEFAAELGGRARAGFPRADRPTRFGLARPRIRVKRPPTTLLAGAASLIAVIAVVVSLNGGDDRATTLGETGGGGVASPDSSAGALEEPATKAESAADTATEPAIVDRQLARRAALAPPDGGAVARSFPRRRGFAPGVRDRRIERSATLTLAAPTDRLDRTAADVAAVTRRYGGFVLSSSLATGDEGLPTGGEFQLRIPTARLDRALAALAGLGQVRSRTQTGDDVTSAFVTTGDRLQAARAERRSLLTRLEGADTDVEAESLRLQLDANAGEINRLLGRIRLLRLRTDYATVAVTLESRDDDGSATPGDGLGGAIDDAIDTLGDSLELVIRALGIAIPLALLVAAVALGARVFRRRRREAVLSDAV
jgi:hypothetical protein